ncbi:DUF1549 and DUF1553 domain-containing protein [Armatimonas sp.]|uniref:DUF1549 and DUF1553 domain-containing protein n=1 Tax=Armatimonas sp. TaxID=1872638 RepID=UPI00286A494D|nr:DUF1549 and DUF1553 domain-containing protein [Armatimonas sp.]
MQRLAVTLAALGLAAGALLPAISQDKTPKVAPSPEVIQQFETHIRPTFVASCLGCHSKENTLGNLRLDAPITAAQAAEIVKRIRGEGGKPRMPQGNAALAPEKIAAMESWAKAGAPWPVLKGMVGGKLWSLEPVKKPAPPTVVLKAWPRSSLDNFILAKLEAAKFKPAAFADRRTLLRRASYELTGLSPGVEEVRAFIADKSPDAWPKAVDKLLASPRYGERMARFWMDIARYADTKGYVFTDDRNYYHAYTYRDWLIQAFNDDMPYDQFLTYQLAADRMEVGEDRRHLSALGYLTLGRRFINNTHDILDDRIDVTMRGMQAMTVACARCHDHKFDPIPTKDYYGLYAIFASSNENQPVISKKEIREPYEAHDGKFQAAKNEREELIRSEVRRLRETVKAKTATPELQKILQGFRENEQPNDKQRSELLPSFEPARRDRLAELDKTMEELKKSYPPTPEFAHAMTEGAPRPGVVFKRGNPGSPGDPAPRHFLTCVEGETQPEFPTGGRLELAKAITDKKNPLTARVIANRLWLLHFGTGIVRTPSDFGRQGEKPTHPELLDWLASTLMEDGWSLKKLQRRMLLSATWMQSSDTTEAVFLKDPENRLYGRQSRRRLELEQLRDSLLQAAGTLDTSKLGGKSEELWMGNYTKRRAVYGFIERQNLPGIFKTLDFATPDATSPQRFKTIVPQQALFLMNSPLAADQARALAKGITGKDETEKVVALYQKLFERAPSKEELNLALNYLVAPDKAALKLEAQGNGPWRYGWGLVDDTLGKISVFNEFKAFVDSQWRVGSVLPDPVHGWPMLSRDGGHPGDSKHMVIRRWVSPLEGTVRVSGTLNHPGTVGDGVRGRVVHSRSGVLGEWVAQKSQAETKVNTIEVKRGDTLDFVVDCRANENTDSFAWAPSVTIAGTKVVGSKRQAWKAEADFGGPPPAAATPLSKWERYAQALMLTNEFLYVD